MFQTKDYLADLTKLLRECFGDRLVYVGLQGSYLRNEATENSDIDVMTVVEQLSTEDMICYRTAIESLQSPEKSCGFLCGREELAHWNPLEICHLLHTTEDYFGKLHALVPSYTQKDVCVYIKLSINNLYHEICHRFIHSSRTVNTNALPATYKSVFYILQNLHYLRTGEFILTKQKLLPLLSGMDKEMLIRAMQYAARENAPFSESFSALFSWCQETLLSL